MPMPCGIPMVWKEQADHTNDCYFCLVPPVKGLSRKKRHSIIYPNISSAIRPVLHGIGIPIPEVPESFSLDFDESREASASEITDSFLSTELHFGESSSQEPHLITQDELNNLVRDLELPISKAELLSSRLQQWNLLASNTKISIFRDRRKDFIQYFSKEGNTVVCKNVVELMASLGISYEPDKWRLFVDLSKVSLKAVLLYNGNVLPVIPLANAFYTKETYENLKQLLNCLHFRNHIWQIRGDLKITALLVGLQTGYTKYCFFLCEWDCGDQSAGARERLM